MIKTMKALMLREYWEHRGAFLKAPIIIGIVLLVISIGAYITAIVLANKTSSTEMAQMALNELTQLSPEQLSFFWAGQMMSTSTLYLMVLFFVLFFFLLGSLFDDRKDQSILFWKSLPISDASTVLSKLITAVILVPLLFTVIYMIVMVLLMLLASIALLFHGQNPWTLVWQPASLILGAKTMLLAIFVQMLWALPIYGWLIFSSSISKRRPFLFAVFIPAIVAFSMYWMNVLTFQFSNTSMFKKPINHLGQSMFPYAAGLSNHRSFNFNMANIEDGSQVDKIMNNMINSILSTDILYGAVFCALMVSLAIWIRRYRNTT